MPLVFNDQHFMASCGAYLDDGRGVEKATQAANDVPSMPCYGPKCSESPPAQVPLRTHSLIVRVLPEAILMLASEDAASARWDCLYWLDARAIDMGSQIFHPPKA